MIQRPLLQELASNVQPQVQRYLDDSGANGTVTVSAKYAAMPPFQVHWLAAHPHLHMMRFEWTACQRCC
jgi:hypothetical protein